MNDICLIRLRVGKKLKGSEKVKNTALFINCQRFEENCVEHWSIISISDLFKKKQDWNWSLDL